MERETYRGWNEPTAATLRRYGLDLDDWKDIVDRQRAVCPVCAKVPSTGRGVIDHEHVRGWKDKPAPERAKYVRGVTCWFCNHAYLGRGITADKAYRAAYYLEDYERRRPR